MSRQFSVLFANIAECAIGISDVSWSVAVTASSKQEAIELAIKKALARNRESGMPPHGIQVSESELRRWAFVFS